MTVAACSSCVNGLELLGAEAAVRTPPQRLSWLGLAGTLLAGGLGALAFRGHRILGFLGASGVTDSVIGLATQTQSPAAAAGHLGRRLVAIGGSLALPSHPVVGYLAAAVAASVLVPVPPDEPSLSALALARAKHSIVNDAERIEVTPVETAQSSTALVKWSPP